MTPGNPPCRRVLLSCVVPRPDGVGIEQRAWSHLTALAALGRPDLLLALTPAQRAAPPTLGHLDALCGRIHVLPLVPTARGRRLSSTARLMLQRLLLWGRPRWQLADGATAALREVWGAGPVPQLLCFRLVCFEVWQTLAGKHGCRADDVVVDFDDIESLAQRRALAAEPETRGKALTWAGHLEARENQRWEDRALRRHTVLVCSAIDRQRLLERQPAARVEVVPNAYAMPAALPATAPGPALRLLFLGTLSYPPNADAVQHLVRDLMPAVRRAWHGPVTLHIAGRRPGPAVLAFHQPPTVQVQADVPDVAAAYRDADVVVVPIRFGSGTRIKILEALSFGRPVVTTTMGVEGLELVHERHLLIADSADAFARCCVRLARDPALAQSLAAAGREVVSTLYDATVVRAHLSRLLSAAPPSPPRRP